MNLKKEAQMLTENNKKIGKQDQKNEIFKQDFNFLCCMSNS